MCYVYIYIYIHTHIFRHVYIYIYIHNSVTINIYASGSKTACVGVHVFYFVDFCDKISTRWFVDAIDMMLRFAQVE